MEPESGFSSNSRIRGFVNLAKTPTLWVDQDSPDSMSQSIKLRQFAGAKDKYLFLAMLKVDSTLEGFEKSLKPLLAHPLAKKIIDATPIASSFEELRKSRRVSYTDNIEGELAWVLHSILEHGELLTNFVTLKTKLEKEFLLDHLTSARETLTQIESLTKSLWSLECDFLLREYAQGVEGNWSFLSDTLKSAGEPIVQFFAEKFSKKAERNISFFSFRTLLENELQGVDALTREYVFFRLNYVSYFGYNNYPYYINIESVNSVIDRYEIVVQIIHELISKRSEKSPNQFLLPLVERLLKKIPNDDRLKQFNNILNPSASTIFKNSREALSLFDNYSSGNFKDCITRAPQLIKEHPTYIEYYEIYCKSLIESNTPFNNTNISPLIDTILDNIYSIYARNERSNDSNEELFKICLSFSLMPWSKQVMAIVNYQASLSSDFNSHQLLYITNSKVNNPRILNFVNNTESFTQINSVLESLESKTCQILKWINTNNIIAIEEDREIYPLKKKQYIGRILTRNNDSLKIINHYSDILRLTKISPIVEEEAVIALYNGFLDLEDISSALKLYVRTHLKNKFMTLKLKSSLLLDLLAKKGQVDVSNLIELPIFYHLTKSDSYSQYVAYDVFTTKHQQETPSNMVHIAGQFPRDMFIFFLSEICKPEVLNYSIYFEGPDQVEYERLEILKILLELDQPNEQTYIQELSEITRRLTIKKFISVVNKGKITINIEELKKTELSKIKEGFNRYKELEFYSKNKDWISVDFTSNKALKNVLSTINEEKIKVVIVNDPSFISFKVMFLDLRDKFILSKEYGLDGYLSTRIRHGTLLNHIRSVFESSNLMSQKNKSGVYEDNAYWKERTPPNLSNQSDSIQLAIKKFSKSIDDFTESILKELIQVKTERSQDNQKALFDYSFTPEKLAYLFTVVREKIKTHLNFIDFIFAVFEEQTVLLLKDIRKQFTQEIKDRYTQIIADFEHEIRNIIKDNTFADLTFSITNSSTNIQHELNNISEWFNLSDPTQDMLMDLESVLQTGVQITNSIYPKNQINPKIVVHTNFLIRGGVNILEIIRILLNNIICHSGLSGKELETKLEAELLEDQFLRFHFTNNLAPSVDKQMLSQKLDQVKDKWTKTELDNINIEGGSGFDKIKKIIVIDMKHQSIYFNYRLDEKNNVTISIGFDVKFYEHNSAS